MAAAMAGGVIAFYQLGYGIAAFGVGPLVDAGVSLSRIFGITAHHRRRDGPAVLLRHPPDAPTGLPPGRSVCPAERIRPPKG